MANRLRSKTVRGELVEVLETSSGFLGGTTYELVVDGRTKESSSDLNYILNQYDRYW